MLKNIVNLWYYIASYHYFYVLLNILQICAFASLIKFILNKFVVNFNVIYCKYLKHGSTTEISILLQTLVEASKKPLDVLICIFCIIAIIDTINANSSLMNSSKILIFILIGTWLLLRNLQKTEEYLINLVSQREHKQLKKKKTTIIIMCRMLKMLVFLFTGLMMMQALHVDVTGFIAMGGASTLILGFAAKELLANFFGGLMIFMDEQFMIGDSIKVPSQNVDGIVEDIGWRLTTIRTKEQSVIYLPNSLFLTIGIENFSRKKEQ